MTTQSDAHEVFLEWLRQLITLSSGIIAFSGTFVPLVSTEPRWPLLLLGVSWLLFIATIVSCLEVVSAITFSRIHNNDSWTKGTAHNMALIAKWSFISGITLFVIFAAASLYTITTNSAHAAATQAPISETPTAQMIGNDVTTPTAASTAGPTP